MRRFERAISAAASESWKWKRLSAIGKVTDYEMRGLKAGLTQQGLGSILNISPITINAIGRATETEQKHAAEIGDWLEELRVRCLTAGNGGLGHRRAE